MPSFDTPEPIALNAQVSAGSVHVIATDRADTVVRARPRDPLREVDVRAAEQTEIEFAGGVLTVRTPRQRHLLGRTGTVDVSVELPAGSRLEAGGAWMQVLGEGPLGEVQVKTASGDIRLGSAGPVHLTAAHGSITVDRVRGRAEISTSSGSVRVGLLDGPAVVKNSYGSTTVAVAADDLRVSGANGDITVERAAASLRAGTARGALLVGEVARGSVQLETGFGGIEIGVRSGTAAWLDVSAQRGQVRNSLTGADAPEQHEETVEVRARSRYGNIDIRRARA
ncbi:DUF4097 family beta strand repeat-containing protein [Kitasatospora sp. NPDC092948]|uniref:DUF4097 family beta strand repeat-containing protein n=1 Tax=Kitasatospora sp. NPDC092948 TaxID=3364088 RepID=UPI0037FE47F6